MARRQKIFVFPKIFEFFKFFSFLLKSSNTAIHDCSKTSLPNGSIIFEIILRTYLKDFKLKCIVVDESDINFYSISKDFIDTKHDYFLLGSCGSLNHSELGRSFVISEAIKGDRGILDSQNKFIFSEKKLVSKSHKMNKYLLFDLTEKKISSSNFLNTAQYLPKKYNDYLFDMETFDFYDLCSSNNVECFSSVRFVTDICDEVSLKEFGLLLTQQMKGINSNFVYVKKRLDQIQNVEEIKKLVRLVSHYTFEFIFSMELEETVQNNCKPSLSVIDTYTFLVKIYNQKIKESIESIDKFANENDKSCDNSNSEETATITNSNNCNEDGDNSNPPNDSSSNTTNVETNNKKSSNFNCLLEPIISNSTQVPLTNSNVNNSNNSSNNLHSADNFNAPSESSCFSQDSTAMIENDLVSARENIRKYITKIDILQNKQNKEHPNINFDMQVEALALNEVKNSKFLANKAQLPTFDI
jgi:hypothetical protein